MLATKIAASMGVSEGSIGRSAGLGRACPISSSPHAVELQDQRHRAGKQQDLQRDIIEPVSWERRIGFGHHAISHVVTGLPSASLPSLMATPIAASWSRMRSDSL